MNLAIPIHKQEVVPLKTLKLADYNPRTIEPEMLEALKLQIKTNGLVQPIVARKEDGLVIGGHQRLAAMKSLLAEQGASPAGIEQAPVPVVFLPGLDDKQAKMLNLALNKISGDWDFQKLTSLFQDINTDLTPDLVQLSGFKMDEVSDMLSLLTGPEALRANDAALDFEIEQGLAAQARKFNFTVDSDSDAAFVSNVLRAFGMTGPGDAASAFLNMARAAMAVKTAATGTEVVEADI